MSIQVMRRLFTVEEYHSIARAGILGEDDRLELIEGEITEMTPIGSRHAAVVDRLTWLFSEQVGRRAIIRVQNPIRLGQRSEPQPDLTLLRPCPDFYSQAHPGPEDILLVIEVTETSTDYDREIKVPLYARWRILEVWLVNLDGEAIEVYQNPSPEGYHEMKTLRRGDHLSLGSFPDLKLRVEEILG
jgi:Uma2 family endonuclease